MLYMVQGAFATHEINLTFMYKRVMKNPRFALRTGVAWKAEIASKYPYKYYIRREPNQATASANFWYYDQTDTSRTKNFIEDDPYKKLQLNLGFEWRSKGKRRLGVFTGLDFFAGLCTKKYSLYDVHEALAWNGEWYAENRVGAIVLLDFRKSNHLYFGASPKVGISYLLSPHWSVSGQVAALAAFSYNDDVYRTPDGRKMIVWNKPLQFDFGINSIMDELNIVYRF